MAVVNPFADDPERGGVWEQGYVAGFAEPEAEHVPPLEPELLDAFPRASRRAVMTVATSPRHRTHSLRPSPKSSLGLRPRRTGP